MLASSDTALRHAPTLGGWECDAVTPCKAYASPLEAQRSVDVPFGPNLVHIIGNPEVERDGIVHCTCNRTYCATDADDVLGHDQHHAEFVRVTRNKGHVPSGYTLREELKNEGRELLRNAANDDDVRVASDMIVRAHYDRSFQRSIENGYGDLHPTLPEYARTIAEDGRLDPRVKAALLVTYRDASRAAGIIGDTIWDPPAHVRTWGANAETN